MAVYPPPNSAPRNVNLRALLLWSVCWGVGSGLAAAVLVTAAVRTSVGIDVAGGTFIAGLPQLWFVVRGTRSRDITAAAWLALGKFSLIAAGFGLWFIAKPEASGFATVLGTAITSIATTLATAKLLRERTTPARGKYGKNGGIW